MKKYQIVEVVIVTAGVLLIAYWILNATYKTPAHAMQPNTVRLTVNEMRFVPGPNIEGLPRVGMIIFPQTVVTPTDVLSSPVVTGEVVLVSDVNLLFRTNYQSAITGTYTFGPYPEGPTGFVWQKKLEKVLVWQSGLTYRLLAIRVSATPVAFAPTNKASLPGTGVLITNKTIIAPCPKELWPHVEPCYSGEVYLLFDLSD